MDHMAALVVNTGFESPSSSLHGAGDLTEATGDDEAEENLGNSNGTPVPLQGIPWTGIDEDEGDATQLGAATKRRRQQSFDHLPLETSALDHSHKPQVAFEAMIDAIATECNAEIKLRGRLNDQIADATFRLQRREKFQMPWDNLPHKKVWQSFSFGNQFKLPLLGRFDKPSSQPVSSMVEAKQTQWICDQPFAGKRLMASRFAQSDDALLSGALAKLRNIILFNPADSQLGRALVSKAGSLIAEDVLQKSLRDSVSAKAVSTIVKRVSDYNKFAHFLVTTCRKRPLCPDESAFYQYVCYMQQSGFGATAGATLLKAWSFFRYTFGVDAEDQASLISGRVRGVVNSMFATKRKLTQAPPIPTDYVYKMELYMRTGKSSRVQTVVGFMLFCIYSCARFGDASRADPACLQFQHSTSSDLTLVEANLSEYKTATGERRAILLPLIALGCGLDAFSWSAEWRLARQRSGADGMAFLMCADDHNGEAWLTRRMTTAEGSFWLKDILVMLGMSADQAAAYSTHSLKATCLSWAAKAGSLTMQERLWLGHHESEESRMAITYARDALVGALIKLRMIVESIKSGLFDPDLSRVDRIAQATGLTVDPKTIAEKSHVEEELEARLDADEMAKAAQLGESDVEDTSAVEANPISLPGEREALGRSSFPQVDLACCFKHRLSGIVHLISDTEKLSCGRKITYNMVPMKGDEDAPGQMEFCEQCRAVIGT